MADARVIVGSIAVHALLLGVASGLSSGAAHRTVVREPPRIEIVDPIAVVPVEMIAPAPTPEPAVAAMAEPARTPTQTPPRPAAEVGASIRTSTGSELSTESAISGTPGTGTRTDPGTGTSRWSRMRGPDLALHEDINPNVAPPPREPEGQLRQDGTGYALPDLVTTMHVSPDGRASFKDKPDIDLKFSLPRLPSAKQVGDRIAGWYRNPYGQTQARRVQDMPRHEQAVDGGWDAGAGGDTRIDNSIEPPERLKEVSNGTVAIFGGKLDITSWAMRKFHVGDPYSSRKMNMLAATHAERAQIRARYTAYQYRRTPELMAKNVARVWREVADPVQRRAALFALWDECAEGEGPEGEAGEKARAIVMGSIRGRLSDTPDAFSTEEIALLDANRTSKQHFAP